MPWTVWPRRNNHESARCRERGFTLIEVLLAATLGALLLLALGGVVQGTMQGREAARERLALEGELHFALERMTQTLRGSRRLLLPQVDTPVRDLLAVTLPPEVDRDGDGFADADNDRDGRIDEDPGTDLTNDGAPGVAGVDDDGDGLVDEGGGLPYPERDDDEDGIEDDDGMDGVDNDGDGRMDEDPRADLNGDGKAGLAGIDDDGDGSIDEGSINDDDEDGRTDEDWLDVVVFRLEGTTLMERNPALSDRNGDGILDGRDVVESPIAEGVSAFSVERLAGARAMLVRIVLELSAGSETLSRSVTVRVGGGR